MWQPKLLQTKTEKRERKKELNAYGGYWFTTKIGKKDTQYDFYTLFWEIESVISDKTFLIQNLYEIFQKRIKL